MLLGVNGPVIIGHGRSDAYAVRNAIHLASQTAESGIVSCIKDGLSATEVALAKDRDEEVREYEDHH